MLLKVEKVLASFGINSQDPDLLSRLKYTDGGRVRQIFGKNFKVNKGQKKGVLTAVAHLSPHDESGYNVCPFAGNCSGVCINKTGQLVTGGSLKARVMRTLLLRLFPDEFFAQLREEVRRHVWAAKASEMVPAIRLNGTSDVKWEQYGLLDEFPEVRWYDYTKWPLEHRTPPDNYHLTYSWSEKTTEREFIDQLNAGRNVAVTMLVCTNNYKGDCRYGCHCPLPSHFKGVPVIDGDKHDARFTEPPGHVIGLRFKRPRGGESLQQIIDKVKRIHAEKKPSFIQIPE